MESAFFLLAKGVWALARPESLILAALALGFGLVALGRRRAGLAAAGAGLAAAIVVGVWPVADLVYRPLEARFPPMPEVADPEGILVLGGGEEPGVVPGLPQINAAGDRYVAAMALARRFPGVPVIVTGGAATLSGGTGRQAETAAGILALGGVEPGRILREDRSRNTAENAERALALRPEGTEAGPWILVTSAWHMPRAVGAFCAAGWQGIVPWPTDFRGGRSGAGWAFARNLDALNGATKEWAGLLGYRLAGRTDALLPLGCPPD